MSARLEAMNAPSPNLSVIAASTLLGSHIPPEALSSYLKLQSDIDIQNGLVREYERPRRWTAARRLDCGCCSCRSKTEGSEGLGEGSERVHGRDTAVLVGPHTIWTARAVGWWLFVDPGVKRSQKFDFHVGPVFGSASAIILILIGYQVFGLMGAAVATAVVVIVVWAWLPKTEQPTLDQ